MNDTGEKMPCTRGCWLAALVAGILAAILLMAIWGWGFFSGLLMGLIIFAIAGFVLNWLLCSQQSDTATSGMHGTHSASDSGASSSTSSSAAPAAAATTAAATTAAATSEPISEPAKATQAPVADAPSEPLIKPSKALEGEAELAERKGDWKYEGAAKPAKPAAKPKTAKPKAAKPKAAKPKAAKAASADPTPDFDNDGVFEGENEGQKPATLSGPRDGKADNLKEIKGIGPKLEKLCNVMGFYHFDQIAAWSAAEVAWVNANLEGFKGRVSRDKWVEQASVLAAGGETEFSKRVEGGGVY
ncbi:MAG: endonuclease [Paracoccaceae bacterium]